MARAETDCGTVGEFGALPLSARVHVDFGAQCAKGRNHPVNGDHHLICRLGRSQEALLTSLPNDIIGGRFDEYGYGMIVADGLGSAIESEAAARTAITTLVRLCVYFGKWNLRIDDDEIEHEIKTRADRFFRHIDLALHRESMRGPVPNLQTSLTGTFGAGDQLFFAHVGHTRAYLFRDRILTQLTRDHTIASRRTRAFSQVPLVDVTVLTRDLTHFLEQTIGMSGSTGPRVDVGNFRLEDSDLILVCSNGVTDNVEEATLSDILSSGRPPDELCGTLVDLAMRSGGEDDATALIARYHIPA
ncbi:MAG TPA: PP2C family serine/threonine-protein phosphatase [Vicinamibacterales bacterium]|nr:PP2C family serine/threonine-protein phosphatase [Vicinamibacterales bacterium]